MGENYNTGLSNIEFVLLQLISEGRALSGYDADKLVQLRGYREWADIGTTSIYTGLDKLSKRGLVEANIPKEKQGKGPLPKKYSLTESGMNVLQEEVRRALASTRERDRRFDVALAALPVLSIGEAIDALTKRSYFLLDNLLKVEKKFKADGGEGLPLHVKALFRHTLQQIKNEMEFVNGLIRELEAQNTGGTAR